MDISEIIVHVSADDGVNQVVKGKFSHKIFTPENGKIYSMKQYTQVSPRLSEVRQ